MKLNRRELVIGAAASAALVAIGRRAAPVVETEPAPTTIAGAYTLKMNREQFVSVIEGLEAYETPIIHSISLGRPDVITYDPDGTYTMTWGQRHA